MIVGRQDSFAVESVITEAFPGQSQQALGCFVIYVGGESYGVRQPDASMLGCSFDEVKGRIERRGEHQMHLLTDLGAAVIVEAFLDATYRETARDRYFGLTRSAFSRAVHTAKIQWAPDGDEAFDDGSHVLQFDVGDKVRLIAFRNLEQADDIADSIREAWIEGDVFYGLLSEWSQLFTADRLDRKRR